MHKPLPRNKSGTTKTISSTTRLLAFDSLLTLYSIVCDKLELNKAHICLLRVFQTSLTNISNPWTSL